MRAFPIFTFTRKVLFLGVFTHLTSLALALPQNQGTPSSNTSTSLRAFTHLSPSLLHTNLPTPTFNINQAERNNQDVDITTETVFSTVIIPTATELVTIVTTPSSSIPSASTSTAASTAACVVQGGKDGGVCVTIIPIWPTGTLAPVIKDKRQASSSNTVTGSSNSTVYKSTATVVSLVVVGRTKTVTDVLTATANAFTTYTLTGPPTTANTSISACTPTDATPTPYTASTSTAAGTETSCSMPSSLVNGHCTYNSQALWNPAPQVPTETAGAGLGPTRPVAARAAVEANWAGEAKLGQAEQNKESEDQSEVGRG